MKDPTLEIKFVYQNGLLRPSNGAFNEKSGGLGRGSPPGGRLGRGSPPDRQRSGTATPGGSPAVGHLQTGSLGRGSPPVRPLWPRQATGSGWGGSLRRQATGSPSSRGSPPVRGLWAVVPLPVHI
uniref:Uncharacterized protein n=1 Tax=Fagus sylvatica TaxID=28930 RepID=A0A2N9I6M5_FAGSY